MQGVLRHCEVFSCVLSGFIWFLKVPPTYKGVWGVLRFSDTLSWFLSGSERFLNVAVFSGVPERYEEF